MKLLLIFTIISLCAVPAAACEFTAPAVPESGAMYMPQETESFQSALWEMFCDAVSHMQPELSEVASVCLSVLIVILLVSFISQIPGGNHTTVNLIAAVSISLILLRNTHSLIHLGVYTIEELSEYGKLLLPIMTSALAAQGYITSSTSLYTGTAIFNTLLCALISTLLIPLIYLYLSSSIAACMIDDGTLDNLSKLMKTVIVWSLRTILYIFTGYIGITGVVSGSTDAAALKAAKLSISGFVPVVGGILADASEAVLVGASVIKNTAGIYGILAIIAVFIGPFIKIGTHYLLLKFTGAISGIAGTKKLSDLIDHFSNAMGLLLAMTGSVCLLLLISTVCYIKGVG